MSEILSWLSPLVVSGGVVYLLIDRFARTKEQKGMDVANVAEKMSVALQKGMENVMTYSQGVIEKQREDIERVEKRNDKLEQRVDRLEAKIDRRDSDIAERDHIISSAHTCAFLKDKSDNNCPVLKGNYQRISDQCATCKVEGISRSQK